LFAQTPRPWGGASEKKAQAKDRPLISGKGEEGGGQVKGEKHFWNVL